MPSTCSLYRFGCKNHSFEKSSMKRNVSFHRFPMKNKTLLQAWVDIINEDTFVPTDHSKICSDHFTPDAFIYLGNHNPKRKFLKRGAIPSIFTFDREITASKKSSIKTKKDTRNCVASDEEHSFFTKPHSSITGLIDCDALKYVEGNSLIGESYDLRRESQNGIITVVQVADTSCQTSICFENLMNELYKLSKELELLRKETEFFMEPKGI